MDGIDPAIVGRAEHALEHSPGVNGVSSIKLRWVGHRLQGAATIGVGEVSVADAERIVHEAQHALAHALPNLDAFDIVTTTGTQAPVPPHSH